MEELIQYLKTLTPLSTRDLDRVVSIVEREEIKKGQFFLQQGQYCKRISFVEKGLFKLFYLHEGKEKVSQFFDTKEFVTDYHSYLTQSPSLRHIQALEDSAVWNFPRQALEEMQEQSLSWSRIGKLMADKAYLNSTIRGTRLVYDDYRTRVSYFLEEHPSLMQRIPQYTVASYLNMTPETLSRIKTDMVRKQNPQTSIHPQLPPEPYHIS